MTEVVYNRGKARLLNGSSTWGTADLRLLIISGASVPAGAYDPDLNTVTDLLGVSGVTEMAGTGYTRKALTTEAVTEDDTNNRAVLDADDITWTGLDAGVLRAAVVYDEGGGTDATRHLISYHDSNFPKTSNGGDMTIQVPVSGVIYAT